MWKAYRKKPNLTTGLLVFPRGSAFIRAYYETLAWPALNHHKIALSFFILYLMVINRLNPLYVEWRAIKYVIFDQCIHYKSTTTHNIYICGGWFVSGFEIQSFECFCWISKLKWFSNECVPMNFFFKWIDAFEPMRTPYSSLWFGLLVLGL